jgi:hypothetical protein
MVWEVIDMTINVNVPIYQEFLEYLAQIATPEQILAFELSEPMQEHIEDLLDKNSENRLTDQERQELEQIQQFDRISFMLKARAAAKP